MYSSIETNIDGEAAQYFINTGNPLFHPMLNRTHPLNGTVPANSYDSLLGEISYAQFLPVTNRRAFLYFYLSVLRFLSALISHQGHGGGRRRRGGGWRRRVRRPPARPQQDGPEKGGDVLLCVDDAAAAAVGVGVGAEQTAGRAHRDVRPLGCHHRRNEGQ